MGCMIDKTLQHVLFLTRCFDGKDVEPAILAILLELGFSAQSDGFHYLRTGIMLKYSNPNQRIMKMLYPAIGRCYEPEAGAKQVEQAIRSAINAAWEDGDGDTWECFFPPNGRGARKPSNGEFISKIACVLELWHSCGKEVCYETR